jgi:hypothetical protein
LSFDKPTFPLTITWHEDAEHESFKNEIDAAVTLEWFDSRDPDSQVSVADSAGRPVTLVVEQLEVKLCQLLNQ